jgi:hypothetical protein
VESLVAHENEVLGATALENHVSVIQSSEQAGLVTLESAEGECSRGHSSSIPLDC